MAQRPRGISWAIGAGLLLFGPGLVAMARLSWEQRRLDRQLAQLKAAHARLAAEETRLRTDPAYVEGLIRTTFKYAKPGEFVIPLDGDATVGTSRQP